MKLSRRRLLHVAAGAPALPLLSRTAAGQTYPSRPVRVVVGYPAGGGTGTLARLLAQWLSERLGQPFIVENRAGAGTNLATEEVIRAPADGYTLLVIDSSPAINASFYPKLNFEFIRDIAPVAGLIRQPLIMEVNPSVPARTVPEFITYAKSNPGKISMASFGTGTISHVAGELFKASTGTDMLHVPYRGTAPALTDLLGGQVQVMFGSSIGSIEYVKSGKLRGLAVTTATRSEALPDIPTVSEFVPGYEASVFFGVCAPRATPPEMVDRLNNEINAGLADPRIKGRIADLGGTPLVLSPAAFGRLIVEETGKWDKVVRSANIRAQ
jgi:tripartite-type tricarboxylate transporter receptor subunit TctC